MLLSLMISTRLIFISGFKKDLSQTPTIIDGNNIPSLELCLTAVDIEHLFECCFQDDDCFEVKFGVGEFLLSGFDLFAKAECRVAEAAITDNVLSCR